ncbi:MAG: S41 family peptidase [Woeseiaceae bacterium]|nr:S41 family peptidase [Woeseiaceae bacterium]
MASQKQFVLDAMRDVYFWNTLLPANVNLASFAGPDDLLAHLISFQPLDQFSYINTAEADSQFFGEGQYLGFGFSFRFVGVDDVRITQVFDSSPAAPAGFARGQRILALDGRSIAEIEAAEGIDTLLDQETLSFSLRNTDGSEFTVSVTKDVVTIDPLPQWRVIDTPGGSVGYMEFATFVSTADPVFDSIFASFRQAGVTDLILDMRYNGGGLISTTELLGDFLGGGVAGGQVFSRTLFNANNAGANRTALFHQLFNSLNLSRLVVIATESTASASELVINSMEPHVEVTIVGDATFGKPVGQVGIEFCSKILRATAFETVNSLNEGGYFGGLPADCVAADDLAIPVGDDQDPNLITALDYLANGACPVTAIPGPAKALADKVPGRKYRHGPPWREFARAY